MKAGAVVVNPLTKRLLGMALKDEAFRLISQIVQARDAGKAARVRQLEKELTRVKMRLGHLGVPL